MHDDKIAYGNVFILEHKETYFPINAFGGTPGGVPFDGFYLHGDAQAHGFVTPQWMFFFWAQSDRTGNYTKTVMIEGFHHPGK